MNVQPAVATRTAFEAPNFNGNGDVENFIQQYLEVAADDGWSETAALLYIRTHLRHDPYKCGNNPTLEEVFKALHSRYEISRWEARTRLAHLKRDIKLSLRDHATMTKKLVKAAYADILQRRDDAGIVLQLHQLRIPTEAPLGYKATKPGRSSGSRNGILADTTQS